MEGLSEDYFMVPKNKAQMVTVWDRNTKFFHTSTLVRRKRNRVEALKDDSSRWVTEEEELKVMASNFFRNLYSIEDLPNIDNYPLRGLFPKLDSVRLSSLEIDFTSEEIKDVIFSMGTLKAPGPDGFHAMFFQSQWNIVGGSICNFIKDCFKNPSRIDDINLTDVILIPKVENPDSIRQFRHITLCNVIYKTITKVITNKIKPLLNDLISPTQ